MHGLVRPTSLRTCPDSIAPRPTLPPRANACYPDTSRTTSLQSTATRLPPLLLAAHQPVWSFWNLMGFTHTPLEQASLAFIPTRRTPAARRQTAAIILAMGLANGLLAGSLTAGLPALFPSLFTSDRSLWVLMGSVWPQALAAMTLCGVDVSGTGECTWAENEMDEGVEQVRALMGSPSAAWVIDTRLAAVLLYPPPPPPSRHTGILLGLKDARYVARAMLVTAGVVAAFVWWVRSNPLTLSGVWWGLVVFFVMRTLQSMPRLASQLLNDSADGGAAITKRHAA